MITPSDRSTAGPPSITDRKGASFATAVKWSYVMDGGRQVLTTLVTFVLARLLGPEVYGVAALALVYVLFVQMLQQQGIVAAIVQRRDLTGSHLDSAFWGTVVVSAVLTSCSVVLSGWYASFSDAPELQLVVVGMSAILPLRGLSLVQEAILRRELDFKSLALRTNLSVTIGGVAALIAAAAGAGVWTLVIQQVLTAAVELIVLWRVADWRPAWRFSSVSLRELLGFSVPSFIAGIAVFLTNQADAVLVGLFFGPVAIGLYRFASRMVETLTNLTVRALQQASLPELSRHQDDEQRFRSRAQGVIRVSAVLSLPPLAVLGSTADELIALLGSTQWEGATSVLRILCIVGAVRAVTLFAGPTLQASGRPGLLASLAWVNAVSSVAAFASAGWLLEEVASVDAQVRGIAWSRAGLAVFIILGQTLWVTRRYLGIGFGQFLASISPGLIGAAGVVAAGTTVERTLGAAPVLVELGIELVACVLSAGVVLAVVSPEVKRAVSSLSGRWSSRSAVLPARTVVEQSDTPAPSPEDARRTVNPMADDPSLGRSDTGLGPELGPMSDRGALQVLGLYLFCLFVFPARVVLAPLGSVGRPELLVGLGALLWWALDRLLPGHRQRGPQPIRYLLGIYLVAFAGSYWAGLNRRLPGIEARAMDRSLITLVALLGVAVLILDGVRTRQALDRLLRMLVFAGGFLGLVGFLQFMFGFDLAQYLRPPGFVLNSDLIGIGQRGGPGFNRVPSTASHPIEFSVVAVMILPIALHYALHAQTKVQKRGRWLIVALLAVSIPFSLSRSGSVALGVMVLFMLPVWSGPMLKRLLIVGGSGFIVLQGAVPGLLGTIRSLFLNAGNDPSVEGRTEDYASIGTYLSERPWLGRGPGTFIPDLYRLLDNQYLQTLMAMGIVGLVAVIILFVGALLVARHTHLRSMDDSARHLSHSLAASVAAAIAASATFDSLAFGMFSGVLFVIFGAIGALWRIDRDGDRETEWSEPVIPLLARPREPAELVR